MDSDLENIIKELTNKPDDLKILDLTEYQINYLCKNNGYTRESMETMQAKAHEQYIIYDEIEKKVHNILADFDANIRKKYEEKYGL